MSDEWGPWIEHDGRGCPVPTGTVVQGVGRDGSVEVWAAGMVAIHPNGLRDGWSWRGSHFEHPLDVMRYRIRKPRGLLILESLLADLPEQVDA